MFASGRLPHAMGRANNSVPIPGAFYNHLHPTSMRYPHSMYRLTAPGGGVGYNVIGPPPPVPSSLSSASSVSSNSSVSPSSQSPASPNLHPTYERYGNYGNFPAYGYGHRDGEAAGNNFNYANLNHRLDINCYYGRPYDSYNRFAANFAYRNAPSDCEMLSNRPSHMNYSSLYGHPVYPELRPGPGPSPGPGHGRHHYYHYGRNGSYDTHPYNYMHLPHTLNRGTLPLEHPQVNGSSNSPYAIPAVSDIGAGSGTESSTYGSQSRRTSFCPGEIASTSSPLPTGTENRNDDSTNNTISHLRNLSSASGVQCSMRPVSPHRTSHQQQHATDGQSAFDTKEEKARKFKDRDRYPKRQAEGKTPSCSSPLGSPAPPSNRAETPFPVEFPGMSNNQTNYFTGSQTTCSQQSPYSNCSPYSWNEQYSPKSVRRRLPDAPASPSNFVNKNRVLECDFIPSKKSRKKITTEDSEYSPEMREEIKDITPLPGFQQAFGSTEIGRFSEIFLNTPERVDYFCESEPDTFSPQPWEAGDSLEGPHYNLHIGATVVQPDVYSENHSSTDSPIETNYFNEIQCSDY
ncbi:unnamed protein product [Hermetia illucens]|uniref:Uncharacterized protein n=2 Tax=Hermetia illucens TaxID=343691 RepID=A0A7R8UM52_HERIL|nr:unnamed protein product [Hermetia illucens]